MTNYEEKVEYKNHKTPIYRRKDYTSCTKFLHQFGIRRSFFAHSDAKILQNSSIIQKISITLSSAIIAYIIVSCCNPLVKLQNICEITDFYETFLIPN